MRLLGGGVALRLSRLATVVFTRLGKRPGKALADTHSEVELVSCSIQPVTSWGDDRSIDRRRFAALGRGSVSGALRCFDRSFVLSLRESLKAYGNFGVCVIMRLAYILCEQVAYLHVTVSKQVLAIAFCCASTHRAKFA